MGQKSVFLPHQSSLSTIITNMEASPAALCESGTVIQATRPRSNSTIQIQHMEFSILHPFLLLIEHSSRKKLHTCTTSQSSPMRILRNGRVAQSERSNGRQHRGVQQLCSSTPKSLSLRIESCGDGDVIQLRFRSFSGLPDLA